MNWLVFAIAAYVMLALEIGLRTLLAVPGPDGVAPSFMLVLAVYVALMAPGQVVPWAALALGVLVDLQPGPDPATTIVGPAALGYLVGGVVVVQLRALVFRQSAVTLAALVLTAGIVIQLVTVGLHGARGLPFVPGATVEGWQIADQLVRRFFVLLYTTALALPVGALLFWSTPIWGFATRGRGER